jgi:signal transduction histidine kinase
LLFPLDTFHNKIKGINEQNLDTRIAVKKAGDEIDLLANEFNLMLGRIDISYKKQKEFTSNASHELRTPIARMMAQIENRLNDPSDNAETKEFYQLLLQDINQLNELTNSLLILSKHNRDNANLKERCRIDEIIYECADVIKKQFDDFKLEINFDSVETMEMEGIKSLLDIAFQNLLRNAYQYSSNKSVKVNIFSDDEIIRVQIENDGPTLTEEDQSKLFETFMRGSNARDKSGLGLGLRIVQRIFNQHDAGVHYKISERNTNVFEVIFRI